MFRVSSSEPPPTQPQACGDRLDSWKEVAAYLKRGEHRAAMDGDYLFIGTSTARAGRCMPIAPSSIAGWQDGGGRCRPTASTARSTDGCLAPLRSLLPLWPAAVWSARGSDGTDPDLRGADWVTPRSPHCSPHSSRAVTFAIGGWPAAVWRPSRWATNAQSPSRQPSLGRTPIGVSLTGSTGCRAVSRRVTLRRARGAPAGGRWSSTHRSPMRMWRSRWSARHWHCLRLDVGGARLPARVAPRPIARRRARLFRRADVRVPSRGRGALRCCGDCWRCNRCTSDTTLGSGSPLQLAPVPCGRRAIDTNACPRSQLGEDALLAGGKLRRCRRHGRGDQGISAPGRGSRCGPSGRLLRIARLTQAFDSDGPKASGRKSSRLRGTRRQAAAASGRCMTPTRAGLHMMARRYNVSATANARSTRCMRRTNSGRTCWCSWRANRCSTPCDPISFASTQCLACQVGPPSQGGEVGGPSTSSQRPATSCRPDGYRLR